MSFYFSVEFNMDAASAAFGVKFWFIHYSCIGVDYQYWGTGFSNQAIDYRYVTRSPMVYLGALRAS